MKRMSVQARTLHRASAVIGGLAALASYLKISDQHIREWMFDVGAPPQGVFLKVIELLLDQPLGSAAEAPADAVSVANDTAANVTRL